MIHILHISDIHLGTADDAQIYLAQLEADLKKELKVNRLEYVVISGDIGTYSTSEEYRVAYEMISELLKNFNLDSSRIVVVPGNHDLNWNLSRQAYYLVPHKEKPEGLSEDQYVPLDNENILLRDDKLYQKRFDYFRKFYRKLCNRNYPLTYDKQGILHEFPNDRILFVALNSSWAIDHINCNRAGINMNSLANSLKQLKEKKYDDWLKIAVWHHPITRQGMMEYAFMRMLAVQGFEICMHGHIHKASQGFYNFDPTRGIHIVGAGTFGAPTDETVTGILYQYNLLKCNGKANEIIVETRKKEEPDGAWKADARWGDPKQPVPIYMIPLISNHPHVPSGRKSVFHFNLGLKRLKPQAVSPCRSAASEMSAPLT